MNIEQIPQKWRYRRNDLKQLFLMDKVEGATAYKECIIYRQQIIKAIVNQEATNIAGATIKILALVKGDYIGSLKIMAAAYELMAGNDLTLNTLKTTAKEANNFGQNKSAEK